MGEYRARGARLALLNASRFTFHVSRFFAKRPFMKSPEEETTEMVLKVKRPVNTDANVPTGAPKPSHVREVLLTLKTRLEAQLALRAVQSPESKVQSQDGRDFGLWALDSGLRGVAGSDWTDTAGDLHDNVVDRAVQDNIVRQLKQVNESLSMIDDGRYGICAQCLKPIEADRLVVRPFATLCLDCQNRLDRGKVGRR